MSSMEGLPAGSVAPGQYVPPKHRFLSKRKVYAKGNSSKDELGSWHFGVHDDAQILPMEPSGLARRSSQRKISAAARKIQVCHTAAHRRSFLTAQKIETEAKKHEQRRIQLENVLRHHGGETKLRTQDRNSDIEIRALSENRADYHSVDFWQETIINKFK